MENIFKLSKCGIIVILTLCILLCTTGIGVHAISVSEESTVPAAEPTAVIVEETIGVVEISTATEPTQELMPIMARACSYNHYEVNELYDNGYVKSVTVTTYYNGSVYDTYTVDYPSSGDDAMEKFHGCNCPMCN